MAEGLARHFGGPALEVQSAGLMSAQVHPLAVAVMKELGIDISGQHSKSLEAEHLGRADIVVALCEPAQRLCPPPYTGLKWLFWPTPDPVGTGATEQERLEAFRATRDLLKRKVLALLKEEGLLRD
jgi:arsenate reductase